MLDLGQSIFLIACAAGIGGGGSNIVMGGTGGSSMGDRLVIARKVGKLPLLWKCSVQIGYKNSAVLFFCQSSTCRFFLLLHQSWKPYR